MSKKSLLVFFLICFFIGVCHADHRAVIARKNASGGGGCMSGTYTSSWDGDYTSDTDKACYNSGAGNKDGTQSGGTLTAASFVTTGVDQYVEWANSAADMFDGDSGTLYVEINCDSGNTADTPIFEMWYDSSNYMALSVASDIGNEARATRVGGGATDTLIDFTDSVTLGSTTTIGLTWQVGRGTNDWGVTVDAGANWYYDGVDGIASFGTEPNLVIMGEKNYGGGASQTVTITRWAIVSGWEATCPW